MGRSGAGRGPQRGRTLTRVRIIGPGRAGQSFARAFDAVGLDVDIWPRERAVVHAGDGVDAVLIATPDRAIAAVSSAIEPSDAVVLHCSGATPLTALVGHLRSGSIHPLMALPDVATGATRLRDNGWFGIAGDPLAAELVDRLGGRHFDIADETRALYHATAAIAANHLVVLLGQVERLAAQVGVPFDAFLELARGSMTDVATHGAVAALTGPAARGDHETIAAHMAALPANERELYAVLAAEAEAHTQRDGAPEQ